MMVFKRLLIQLFALLLAMPTSYAQTLKFADVSLFMKKTSVPTKIADEMLKDVEDGFEGVRRAGLVPTCGMTPPEPMEFSHGCPRFLFDQMLDDRKKPFSIWRLGTDMSAQEACTSLGEGIFQPIPGIYQGTSANEIEAMLNQHPEVGLSLPTNSLAFCMDTHRQHSGLSQLERSVVVSEYYTRMNQLKDGAGALYLELRELESIVTPGDGKDHSDRDWLMHDASESGNEGLPLVRMTAPDSAIPGLHEIEKQLAPCRNVQNKQRDAKFSSYIDDMTVTLTELHHVQKKINNGSMRCSGRHAGNNREFCRTWKEESKKLTYVRDFLYSTNPALASKDLRWMVTQNKVPDRRVIEAETREYLRERRAQTLKELKDFEKAGRCLKGDPIKCDYQDITKRLATVHSVHEPYPQNREGGDISKEEFLDRNIANASYNMMSCRDNHRNIIANQHDTFTQSAVDIGLSVATLGIASLAAGSARLVAAAAKSAKAGKDAVNAFKATRTAQIAALEEKRQRATRTSKIMLQGYRAAIRTADAAWSTNGLMNAIDQCEERFIVQSEANSNLNTNGCEENIQKQLKLQRDHKSCALGVVFAATGMFPVATAVYESFQLAKVLRNQPAPASVITPAPVRSTAATPTPTISAPKVASTPKYKTKPMKEAYQGENLRDGQTGVPVKYLTPEELKAHQIFPRNGQIYDANGNLLCPKGNCKGIFVMDDEGRFFFKENAIEGEFHHSSFLSGKPVAGAGELIFNDGKLHAITNLSGHYRPPAEYMHQVTHALEAQGIILPKFVLRLTLDPSATPRPPIKIDRDIFAEEFAPTDAAP
ncbi:MAG: hypothetical protein ACLGG0_12825 [Bacteriovoracia bacterium]